MNNNEPRVLGKIKKGKTGNPVIVIIIFLLIGIFVVFLPTVLNYFGDNNVITLITEGKIVDFFVNHDNYVNTSIKPNTTIAPISNKAILNSKAIIKYNNFTISDVVLQKEKISYKITTSQSINFDESNYYFVLSKDSKDLVTIKLTNTVSSAETFNYSFLESLNDIVEISGEIKEIKQSDYPSFTLSSDESGLSSLKCTLNEENIDYTFNNNKLSSLKYTYEYVDDSTNYYQIFKEYSSINDKINNAGGLSTIEENDIGFILKADVKLDIFDTKKYLNYNYYSLNTKSNIINYEMKAKGYDCK